MLIQVNSPLCPVKNKLWSFSYVLNYDASYYDITISHHDASVNLILKYFYSLKYTLKKFPKIILRMCLIELFRK